MPKLKTLFNTSDLSRNFHNLKTFSINVHVACANETKPISDTDVYIMLTSIDGYASTYGEVIKPYHRDRKLGLISNFLSLKLCNYHTKYATNHQLSYFEVSKYFYRDL